MSLTEVKMSEDVWLTCLSHALSTETEEVMGLLLGDIQCSSNGDTIALIWGASPQMRSDRQKDRVETNPEQLAAASAQAEMLTQSTGRTTRVIGWYHSHPHITVLPSHVDIRTQAMYQLLDSGFVGLIFSCFSEDPHKVGRIQVTAFQSLDCKQRHLPETAASPSSSSCVRPASASGLAQAEGFEQDTGNSKAIVPVKGGLEDSHSHPSQDSSCANASILALTYPVEESLSDVNYVTMSASFQEAVHRSTLDISGAEYMRKEIPLQVLPIQALFKLDCPLISYSETQSILFEEEHSAYCRAILENSRDGKLHPLAFMHHTCTYHASLCKLIEYCLTPAINMLRDRLKENDLRLASLLDEAEHLDAEAFNSCKSLPASSCKLHECHSLEESVPGKE